MPFFASQKDLQGECYILYEADNYGFDHPLLILRREQTLQLLNGWRVCPLLPSRKLGNVQIWAKFIPYTLGYMGRP